MTEYIEREAVVDLIQQYANGNVKVEEVFLLTDLLGDITNIKAADVQPVKRGEWVNECIEDDMNVWWAGCSVCGEDAHSRYGRVSAYNYCPNCGADMRGEDNAKG